MRDLHLSHADIGDLTIPQVYLYMQCLREVNQAKKQEYEMEKRKMEFAAFRMRGR
jgi:hypothetical protein